MNKVHADVEAHRDRSRICRNHCIKKDVPRYTRRRIAPHPSTPPYYIVRCRGYTPNDALTSLRFWEVSIESREPMSEGINVRPRNWLVPVALLTLREKSTHGYELMERLAGFGFEEINPGTVYRTLRQMETEGLCESEWETSGCGPACRVYSVTESGEAHLN